MIIPYHKIEPEFQYIMYSHYRIIEKYCINPLCTCLDATLIFVDKENEEENFFSL